MAKRYSEPDIEKGLALAATIGIKPAAAQLGIPPMTLQNWTQDRAERYAQIKTEQAPRWREHAAAKTEEIVETLASLEAKAAAKLEEDLDRLEPKEIPNALKAITVSKGINADHVAKYRGQPAVTVEHTINMPQIDQAIGLLMQQAEKQKAIDVESVELVDAEQG